LWSHDSRGVYLVVTSTANRPADLLRRLCCDDVVNSQQQTRTLNSRLDALLLNRERLPHAVRAHVDDLAGVAINTPEATANLAVLVGLGMLRAQLGQDLNRAVSRVLNDGAGNDFHRLSDGLIGPLCNAFNQLRPPLQPDGNGHLGCTTSRAQLGVPDNVPGNTHRIVQVALNLVQDVLGGAAEEDCACLGVLALCEVGEVLVTELGDFEKTALGANVGGSGSKDRVDNGGASCAGDTVVVCFANTADGCDVGLDEVVLCEIWLR
jgi:hypothetical protein